MTDRRPGIAIVADGGAAEAWANLLATLGWPVRPLRSVGAEHLTTLALWVEVDGRDAAAAALLAVLAGAVVVVGRPNTTVARRCTADLAAAGSVVDVRGRDGGLGDLHPTTLLALRAIGDGATVAAAARQTGSSLRTLHRRLAEARAVCGAPSNAAAALALAEATRDLPRPPADRARPPATGSC